MGLRLGTSMVAFGLLSSLASSKGAEKAEPAFTSASFWAAGFAAAPRIPLAGDADGDGRADLLVLYPAGEGIVDCALTSLLGKPLAPAQARTRFGRDGLAAASGDFAGTGRAAVLGVFADGSVRVAADMASGRATYRRDDLCGMVPAGLLPKPPVQAATADFDADGRPDVLLSGADGRLLLLRAMQPEEGAPRFRALPVGSEGISPTRLAAGRLRSRGAAEVVWLDGTGGLFRAALVIRKDGSVRLAAPSRLLQADPGDGLAVGRFQGGRTDDILVGRRLLVGGRPDRLVEALTFPPASESRDDVAWLAADLNGDGRDDLLRVRRSVARFVGDDLLAHFATGGGDTYQSTANDGLPDMWKTGRIRPGGLDLKALGCDPGRRSVIVEVQRFEDVDEGHVRRELERAARYFATLPITNPDGSTGVSLHVLFREPIPMSDAGKGWFELGEKYHPVGHRGVTHWMVVSRGGGGQSGTWTDRGGCGDNALYATFLHEFGHQIGLDHNGYWGAGGCPAYPSLMNYPYNYQVNGVREDIAYSDGRLADLVLDERRLSEKLPLAPERLSFLAGPPYRYRMKPDPDNGGTVIDWNWNGVFGEENIAADINYGYSTTAGLRHTIGKAYTAPALAAMGEGKAARLLLFVGALPEGAALLDPNAPPDRAGLGPDMPGRLRLRAWRGQDPAAEGERWSDEYDVEPDGVTGDPSVAIIGEDAWVAYPTVKGVRIRRVTWSGSGEPTVGEANDVPGSEGAQPTLVAYDGRFGLLLWRDREKPVTIRPVRPRPSGLMFGPESSLGFTSAVPVGAAVQLTGPGAPSLWIGLSQDQDAGRPSRWQVRRFGYEDGAFVEREREWVGGESGAERGVGRVTLLWEADPAFPAGQFYLFGTGVSSLPYASQFVAKRVADKSVNGGWLTRRYYDEWTQSRSGPGACFFRGDIAYASRWFGNVHGTENDNVFVAFFGRGIEPEPMGDFDDISLIRDAGLSHSIAYLPR